MIPGLFLSDIPIIGRTLHLFLLHLVQLLRDSLKNLRYASILARKPAASEYLSIIRLNPELGDQLMHPLARVIGS